VKYLTNQDLLWINSQLLKRVVGFRVMDLEECIGYQYAYKLEPEVYRDAGRFFEGLLRRKPFDEGNEVTALVAALCLLKVNGLSLTASREEAHEVLERVSRGDLTGAEALRSLAQGEPEPIPDGQVASAMRQVLSVYA
jgi:prophage maintenance system killer protein